MLPKLTVYAKLLYLLMVLVVGTNCYSQDVRLHAECPQRGVTAENRNVLATDNTGVPPFITITSHLRQVNDRTVTHLTLYVKDKDMYICFNKKWQPRLFKHLNEYCYFNETMESGYSLFNSNVDSEKYLGFNRKGRPINYTYQKIDKKCFHLMKLLKEDTDMNSISTTSSKYDYSNINDSEYSQSSISDSQIDKKKHLRKKHKKPTKHPDVRKNNKEFVSKASGTFLLSSTIPPPIHHKVRHHHDLLSHREPLHNSIDSNFESTSITNSRTLETFNYNNPNDDDDDSFDVNSSRIFSSRSSPGQTKSSNNISNSNHKILTGHNKRNNHSNNNNNNNNNNNFNNNNNNNNFNNNNNNNNNNSSNDNISNNNDNIKMNNQINNHKRPNNENIRHSRRPSHRSTHRPKHHSVYQEK